MIANPSASPQPRRTRPPAAIHLRSTAAAFGAVVVVVTAAMIVVAMVMIVMALAEFVVLIARGTFWAARRRYRRCAGGASAAEEPPAAAPYSRRPWRSSPDRHRSIRRSCGRGVARRGVLLSNQPAVSGACRACRSSRPRPSVMTTTFRGGTLRRPVRQSEADDNRRASHDEIPNCGRGLGSRSEIDRSRHDY
jgi:hypothetical protein